MNENGQSTVHLQYCFHLPLASGNRVLSDPKETIWRDLHLGGCGVVRIEGCRWVPSVQKFCTIGSIHVLSNPASLFLAVLQLAGTAISSTQAQLEVHTAIGQETN